jgi:hypothetical protein
LLCRYVNTPLVRLQRLPGEAGAALQPPNKQL